ncbi:MAG: site-2 protease family protein [Myxococcales bacterium]|nr:site-2 protease family protein [Myxococcales bacterium]
MGGSLKVARVAGIDLKVHWSFVLVPVLGALQWGGLGTRGALFGAVLMLLIFGFVALHELGHSLVARAFGIPVKDITLMPLGGIALLGKKPKTPGQELLIALAGPAVNVVLALGLGWVGVELFGVEALERAVQAARVEQPTEVTLWAMVITSNVALAVFNMIPALPMDGGRVLRAFLAWFLGFEKATKLAASLGRLLAVGLGVLGLVGGNPLLPIIAVFIFFAAGAEARDASVTRVLEGIRAADAVNPYAPRFQPATTLGEAMQALIFTPYSAFAVEHFGRLVGVVTREQVMAAVNEWGAHGYVAGVMERQVPTVDGREPLEAARQKMNEALSPFVAVLQDGLFLGLITEVELAQQAQWVDALKSGQPRRREARPVER